MSMKEHSRRRLISLALVCSGFAFGAAVIVALLGPRTLFSWILLGGTFGSVVQIHQLRRKTLSRTG
jgi:hypothetical protein